MEGTKYDDDKIRVDLALQYFPRALAAIAEVCEFGAMKYEEDNWKRVENGYKRYTSAKARHMLAKYIEKCDPESKLYHEAHEAWNCLAALELFLRDN